MKTVKIAGRNVLAIGFGTWHMGDHAKSKEQEIQAIRTGIEAGIQVIDTAEMYGSGRSEMLVGEAIKPYRREDLFLISKVLPSNASKRQLSKSLDASLKRLGTDYLDQYLLHWRGSVPLSETVEALEEQKQKGKIKSWGVSNLDTDEIEEILALEQGAQCQSNQLLYNIGERGIEFDLLPFMRQHNIPLIAYSPVAQGDSFGAGFTKQKVIIAMAQKYQSDVYQLALAWCIRDGNTIAIPQSSNPDHVRSNVQAATIELTQEDLERIDQLYPKPSRKEHLAMI
ncbi:aldo/keto reductase [Fundicoccus culcitae]|uniref:Aldo/keto reductase n=1 Tax=Fundicoccus culcitae TaxID=2969821 RepID=A0ABY5P3Q0_9LACT|nr:aldo/keto reductase [Fundicoccus culcitae]UUX33289.1 aldo/keto reductase [Fundicoccus culcitae]